MAVAGRFSTRGWRSVYEDREYHLHSAPCWSIMNRDAAKMPTRLSCQLSFESPRCCAVTFSGFCPCHLGGKVCLIFEDRLTGKVKLDPQDLSDLVGAYRELGSRVHRQNDVESRLSTMGGF